MFFPAHPPGPGGQMEIDSTALALTFHAV